MRVISRTREAYISEFVSRYPTGLAVGVEDVLPYALRQESSCVKDLQWRQHQLVEVKTTAIAHLGWPQCLRDLPKRGKKRPFPVL